MSASKGTQASGVTDVEMDELDRDLGLPLSSREAQHATSAQHESMPASDVSRGCQASDRTIVRTPSAHSRDVAAKDSSTATNGPSSPKDTSNGESNGRSDGYQGGSGFGRILTVDGESYAEHGYLFTKEGDVIWVDFSPDSPHDPLSFALWRKWAITFTAIAFTWFSSWNVSAYAIGENSMERDLHATPLQAAAGLGLYAWGFAIFPLVLAPFSEEFGRRWMYIFACLTYWLCYFPVAKAQSMALLLPFRFLAGGFGSVGATLVGGSLADIWATRERGFKMGLFALCAVLGTALAPVPMAWVEMNPRLEWRWIQWIQVIVVGVYLPVVPILLPETRSAILLQRKAKALRKQHASSVKQGRYTARSEVGKLPFAQMMRVSLTRPLHFLVSEPIVTFFSLWIALGWGVLYGEIQSIPYVFELLYNLNIGHIGLIYLSLVIGCLLGFGFNLIQERIYKRNVEQRGPEARLYAAMVGGCAFAAGCFIYAWTSYSNITPVAPAIGIALMLFAIYSIYLSVFNYLADSYLAYASSALAGQSFLRNLLAGAFPFFTTQMYENLTPHYASTLFGCLAAVLAVVPFIAFRWGPQIRARSPMSRKLLQEEERMRLFREEQAAKLTGQKSRVSQTV